MATIIVPTKKTALFGEGSLREHLKSLGVKDDYFIEELPAWDPRDTDQVYGLSRVETSHSYVFQEVHNWAQGLMASAMDTLIEILNSVKIVHYGDITLKYAADNRGRSYFFDAETPNGSLTFHLVLEGGEESAGGGSESTNVWYVGRGDLFRNFHSIADTQLKNFISAVFLAEIRKTTSDNLVHFPKMNFLAQHGVPVNGEDLFEGWELRKHLVITRKPLPYDQIALVSEGDTSKWFKVGDGLSGASLVTRIRQGKINGIDPRFYKAKSVKDPSTGQYAVWVQYTTEPQDVDIPTDADSLAQAAWERIEDRVRSLFVEEFKAAL